jgi:hypothetical protein
MATVGELVVELGIKGSEKAIAMAKSFKDSLTDVSSQGLLAKASLLALVYGVQRLVLGSAQMGANFQQFANYTQLSTDKLQQWQYAMLQSNVAANETQDSVVGLQAAIGKMKAGFGAPMGYGYVNSLVGLNWNKIDNAFYGMDKLREYLKKEKNIPLANQVAASFNLSPGVIQAMRSSDLDINKMPVGMSKGSIANLASMNRQWENLTRSFDLFKAKMAQSFGGEAIKTLQNVMNLVGTTAINVSRLTKELPIIKDIAIAVGVALALAFAPVTTVITGILLLLSEVEKAREKRQGIWQTMKQDAKQIIEGMYDFRKTFGGPSAAEQNWHAPMLYPGGINSVGHGGGDKHASLNQTINNYGVKDHEIAANTKAANNFALRQITTLLQVA